MGKELFFLPLLLLLPLGICHVVPCLQILLSQDPLSVAEKPKKHGNPSDLLLGAGFSSHRNVSSVYV